MTATYCVDEITLDSDRITEKKDPFWGDVTVFHDVVIASEIVQPYLDGLAYKSRGELEAYTPTVDGRWVMTGKHPDDGIISDRSQIHGRTVNPRYCKNLIDPKTLRPNRHGVRADVEIFNDRISADMLENMVKGVKKDVSIGFFFTKDANAGVVADGVFKGTQYDYIQTNMFHDHLAAGIDQGRCPSPYCGLGADSVKQRLTGDPFAGFSNFAECESKIRGENPDLTDEQVAAICGKLKSEHEDDIVEDTLLSDLKNKIHELLRDEIESIKGEKLGKKEENVGDWWRRIEWGTDENRPIFNNLTGDVQTLIIEAGLCPDCKGGDGECEEGYHMSEEGECVPDEEEEEEMEDMSPEEETPVEETVDVKVKTKTDPYDVLARFDALKNGV